MPNASRPSVDWPGKRLGLPQSGARSVARPGRRILALILDWLIASVIALTLFRWDPTGPNTFPPLIVFAVMQVLFIATVGGSVGHLALGMRVVPLNPAWIGVVKPIARTVLLCVVVPAVIWDRDQRGMHDRLSGTVLVRR